MLTGALSRFDGAIRLLLRAILVLLCVVVIVFFLMRFAPGDPIRTMLGEGATPEAIAALRERFGLDQPIAVQLWRFIYHMVTGDFGTSMVFQRPALDLILEAAPKTLLLGAVSFAITLAVSVPVGIIAALKRGTKTEMVINNIILLMQVIPPFWAGVMLIHVFSLQLHLLPTSGIGGWEHLVLPSVTLSLFQIALTVRTLRSAMLEVLREDFVRTARAKGLPRGRIIIRHALKNALAPVITVMAFQLGAIFSGAVITEAVFSWPGLGALALNALLSRDYAMAQAVVIFTSAVVVLLNMFADVLISAIDPRARTSRSGH